MSKLLNKKQSSVVIPEFDSIASISKSQKSTTIIDNKGRKFTSKCIACKNKKCCYFSDDELKNNSKKQFPFSTENQVCPTNAISFDKNGYAEIDDKKCIACGLCALRCKFGAIHVEEVAKTEKGGTIISEPSSEQIKKKEKIEEGNFVSISSGKILSLTKTSFLNFYEKFSSLLHRYVFADLLVRNIFLQLNCDYGIRRKGDNVFRIDGILQTKQSVIVTEVELSEDVLEAPRSILDDIAMYRYKLSENSDKVKGLIVLSAMPNARAELWQVIKDIKKVLNIEIDVVTIGTLLFLMWNEANLNLDKMVFYTDKYKNRSIPNELKLNTSFAPFGFLSIFETKK